MISTTAEYALRATVFLAEHPGSAYTLPQLAEVTKVPAGYLSKVMQGLRKAGIVLSQRGIYGGFTLARHPSEFTMYDIIQAVDPIKRITKCPMGLKAHCAKLCPLHQRLDDTAALMEKQFRESPLTQVLIHHSFSPRAPESEVQEETVAHHFEQVPVNENSAFPHS
jgi:Rrf2 family nitric oxide-sensitive transcriptional repressor